MLTQIQTLLSDHPWKDSIHYFSTIDSTNTYAKQLASRGAPQGTVVIAGTQTGGRGRLGRSFSSPADMGIYLSVILRPDCKPDELMHLTCATAVASCEAVKVSCGQEPVIKWTNDLILGRRKLGGILTELSIGQETGMVDWVVVGVGINCCQKEADFPPEIRDMACSLGITPQDRASVAAALIRSLASMAEHLQDHKAAIMDAYRGKCVTLGREISVLRGDSVRYGIAVAIDDDGGLTAQYPDGTRETVTSGEVSIRGMYGYL